MANVTTPTESTLPVAGGDIIAAPLSGWITNLKNFVEGANIDENNVDYTSFDGIVVKAQTQTLSGAKTFSSAITATAGLITGGVIISDTDSTDDLGSTTKRFANLYVDSIGDTGQDLTIAATTTNLPSGHITDYNSADVTITHAVNTLTIAGGNTVVDSLTSGGNIVSDTDSTDDLGTTSVRWANLYVDDITVTNNVTVGGTLTLTGGLTLNGNVTVGDSASDTLTINSTITSNLLFTDATYDIGASGATRPRDLFLSRNAVMGGTLGVTGATTLSSTLGVTGALTATAGITSGSDIVSDSDSTDDLGTTSVRWANLYVDSIGDTGQALAITAGSNNVNVTAGTLALTGAQTISSTLGVTGLITATGGVSGALTGNVTGNLTGNVTGDVTGDLTGNVTGNLTGDVTGNISGNVTGGTISGTTGTFSGATTVGSAGATADFAVYTDGTSSTAAGFTVDASADEVIVGQLSGGGNTTFKVRNRLNNTVFSVTPDAPSTTVFAPNIATGSAGTLTVKTGSINSDSIRLEAGGTASTWLESRGYLGHSWYVDTTRSMTLDSTGLGVGTDAPQGTVHARVATDKNIRLQVIGAYAGIGALNDASSSYIQMNLEASDLVVGQYSGGNMGLGVTPSAWSGRTAFEIEGASTGYVTSPNGPIAIGSNIYYNGGDKFVGNGYAPLYALSSGNHIWYTSNNNTSGAGAAVTLTQAMTLTSAGLLGISTSSPSTKIHASGASSASALRLDESTSGANSYLGYLDTSGNFGIDVNGGGYLRFAVGGAERARITSAGAIEIPNQNAINELTFTGTDFTNVFSQTTSGMQFGTTGAGSYLALYTANAERARILSDGRIGIGTSSPLLKLHVQDDVTGGAYNQAVGQIVISGASNTNKRLNIGFDTSTDKAFLQSGINGTGYRDLLLNPNGGNLGIGTSSPTGTLQVKAATNSNLRFYDSSGRFVVEAVNDAVSNNTDLVISAEELDLNTNGASALYVDSSQRVGIGTASPTSGYKLDIVDSGNANVYIRTTASSAIGNTLKIEGFQPNGVSAFVSRIEAVNRNSSESLTQIDSITDSVYNSGALVFKTASTGTVAERARLDSSGNLLIGRTGTDQNAEIGLVLSGDGYINHTQNSSSANFGVYNNRVAASTNYLYFKTDGLVRGSIQWTSSSTSYNTTSDYRLKENVVGITDGITRIKSLKPSRFNFIADADRTVDGFVAHEVSDIVPEAISGAKDAVDDEGNPEYQGIDQSKLVPLLTAALQEAITKIETLETKVAALEAA